MAQHENDDDLPLTWPFRAAGTMLLFSMAWFCLGFASEDFGNHLAAFWDVFWGLIIAAGVLIVGGAAFNVYRERARHAS